MATSQHPTDRLPPVVTELAAITEAGQVGKRLAGLYPPLIARIKTQQLLSATTASNLAETQNRISELSGRAAAALKASSMLDGPTIVPPSSPPAELRLLGDLIDLQERAVEGQERLLGQQTTLLEIQRQAADAGSRALWWVKAAVFAAVVIPLILHFV